MLIKKPSDIPSSEITPKSAYINRRKFMAGATLFGTALATGAYELMKPSEAAQAETTKLTTVKSQYSTTEPATPQKDIASYNNFYEFSTDKHGPSELARKFRTRPWTVKVEEQSKRRKPTMSTP